MEEYRIPIRIGGGSLQYLTKSQLLKVYRDTEDLKKHLIEKGAPRDSVERAFFIEIVRDEN